MGDLLTGWPAVAEIGLRGFAILVCLLIVTGKIPTGRELRDTQARADRWETAATEWQSVATKLGMSVERLLVLAETSNHALTEIQAVLHRPGDQEVPR